MTKNDLKQKSLDAWNQYVNSGEDESSRDNGLWTEQWELRQIYWDITGDSIWSKS